MQPISLLMSHFNVENNAQQVPNALAAAQDTAQGQELVREGIRAVQTVQASEAAAGNQRVHRKNSNDERDGQGREQGKRENSKDRFEHTENENESESKNKNKDHKLFMASKLPPIQHDTVKDEKSFDFYV